MPQSRRIRQGLIAQGYNIPDIETLATGPSVTEVRYFDSAIGDSAVEIAEFLKQEGISDATAKLIPDYQHVKRRRQIFEIWFSPHAC